MTLVSIDARMFHFSKQRWQRILEPTVHSFIARVAQTVAPVVVAFDVRLAKGLLHTVAVLSMLTCVYLVGVTLLEEPSVHAAIRAGFD